MGQDVTPKSLLQIDPTVKLVSFLKQKCTYCNLYKENNHLIEKSEIMNLLNAAFS